MAKVKKVKPEEVTVEVETPVVTEEVTEEVTENVDVVEDVVETVEIPEVETEQPKDDVEVDTKATKVDSSNKPSGNVKIRMRVDHKCTIAMERYDLKAGKTYTVPENVKRILNNAGLLAPL